MKIYLDLDGVLYNWNKRVCQLCNVNYDDPAFQQKHKNNYSGVEKAIGKDLIDQRVIEAGEKFWLELEKFSWADDLVHMVQTIAGRENVYFCTSYGRYLDGPSGKAKVIKRDFGLDKVILIRDKYLLAQRGTLLIDDKPDNIYRFEANGGWGWLWANAFEFSLGDKNPNEYIETLHTYINYLQKFHNVS